MTHKLTITVETEAVEAEKGIAPGKLKISITDSATGILSFEKEVEGVETEFEGVADGEYLIAVCRLDANGVMIGSAVSNRFIVAVEPVVMIDMPVGFSVVSVQE